MKNRRENRNDLPALRPLNDVDLGAATGAGASKSKDTGSTPRPAESISFNFTQVEVVYAR